MASSNDGDLFSESVAAAVLLGIVGGLVLMAIGLAVATNWKQWLNRFTDFSDYITPSGRLPFLKPLTAGEERRRAVLINRICFAVLACFGVALFVGGVAATIGHIG